MNKIVLDIKSKIEQIDGDVQKIEMLTEGELFQKNGSTFIIYHESEVSGMQGSKTMLKLSNKTVTMTRFGQSSSKMVFDIEKEMNSLYKTPYGNFDMKITTKKVNLDLDLEAVKGLIEIEYQIVLESVSSSINYLSIRIKS